MTISQTTILTRTVMIERRMRLYKSLKRSRWIESSLARAQRRSRQPWRGWGSIKLRVGKIHSTVREVVWIRGAAGVGLIGSSIAKRVGLTSRATIRVSSKIRRAYQAQNLVPKKLTSRTSRKTSRANHPTKDTVIRRKATLQKHLASTWNQTRSGSNSPKSLTLKVKVLTRAAPMVAAQKTLRPRYHPDPPGRHLRLPLRSTRAPKKRPPPCKTSKRARPVLNPTEPSLKPQKLPKPTCPTVTLTTIQTTVKTPA